MRKLMPARATIIVTDFSFDKGFEKGSIVVFAGFMMSGFNDFI